MSRKRRSWSAPKRKAASEKAKHRWATTPPSIRAEWQRKGREAYDRSRLDPANFASLVTVGPAVEEDE